MRCRSDHRLDTWLPELCQNHSFAVPEKASARPACKRLTQHLHLQTGRQTTGQTKTLINYHAAWRSGAVSFQCSQRWVFKDGADKQVCLQKTPSQLNYYYYFIMHINNKKVNFPLCFCCTMVHWLKRLFVSKSVCSLPEKKTKREIHFKLVNTQYQPTCGHTQETIWALFVTA